MKLKGNILIRFLLFWLENLAIDINLKFNVGLICLKLNLPHYFFINELNI